MTKIITSFIGLAALACIGCANRHPLQAELVGLPSTVKSGLDLKLKLRVRNTSKSPQSLPPPDIVTRFASFSFEPDSASNPNDGPISRKDVNWCPPVLDTIRAGEIREYHLRWKPAPNDYGAGVLKVEAPPPFPRVPPQLLSIIGDR
jgi:hypothetical protein